MAMVRSTTTKGAYMIRMDCQGTTTNTLQHKRFCSANEQDTPRTRGWRTSIVRNEDMDDADFADSAIDAAHEASHVNLIHFIS